MLFGGDCPFAFLLSDQLIGLDACMSVYSDCQHDVQQGVCSLL